MKATVKTNKGAASAKTLVPVAKAGLRVKSAVKAGGLNSLNRALPEAVQSARAANRRRRGVSQAV